MLDPCSGSGTIVVVAAALTRRYIGIDISENYVAQARARLKDSRSLFDVGT